MRQPTRGGSLTTPHTALRAALLLAALALPSLTVSAAGDGNAIPSKLAAQSLLLAGGQHGTSMVVAGERGHILHSRDSGHNWQQAQVPSRVLLTGLYLLDEKTGWAVGHDATILKTEDGGKQWRKLFSDPEAEAPLLDIWFGDARHGIAIGAYGLMYRSDDGGESWQRHQVNGEDDYHLNQISQGKDGTLYIAAEAGMVYRSEDGGESWQTLDSPYHGSLFGTLPIDGESLFLYGLRGHLFRSSDRGATWQPVATGTTAMITGALRRGSQCLFTGLSGVLLLDEGCDGQGLVLQQLPGREGLAAALASDKGELVLLGEHGIMRHKP